MTAQGCKAIQLQAVLSQINQIHKPTTIFVRLILQLSFYLCRSSRNTVINIHVQNTEPLSWILERLSAPQWRTWAMLLINRVQGTTRGLLNSASTNKMHGATTKIINAQQARLNNIYKNTKLKLLKTNASIWFNKICRDRQLKPKYISYKMYGATIKIINIFIFAVQAVSAKIRSACCQQ